MPPHDTIAIPVCCAACGHRDSVICYSSENVSTKPLGVCQKCGSKNEKVSIANFLSNIPTLIARRALRQG